MPTSVAFYRDVLGFEIVHQSRPGDMFDWALLKHGDAEVMLNTMYESDARPPAPDRRAFARHDDTCLFFGCPDGRRGLRTPPGERRRGRAAVVAPSG